MLKIKKILVTTDLSELSAEAFPHAVEISRSNGAEVHLLYTLDDIRAHAYPVVDQGSETLLRDREGDAGIKIRQLLMRNGIEEGRFAVVVRRGHPIREILRYARQESIDLIIMATHGRSGLSRLVMGSVAEKIVRFAPMPVLTVKPRAVSESLLTESEMVLDLHLFAS